MKKRGKYMQKSIILLCLAIILMLLCASCDNKADTSENIDNKNPDAEDTSETTTESGFVEDDLGEFDFGGYEFGIWSRIMPYFHGYIDVEEESGDILDDSIYRRNRKIEERFNVTFKEVTGDDDSGAKKTVMAGDNVYDIINTRVPNAYVWAQEGIVQSVEALSHINLSKPYWHQDLNKELSVAGKMYFASGAYNLTTYDFTEALLFNKNLTQSLGIEDLYTLVSEGKWTFDKFAEYCLIAHKDLDGDGKISLGDQHGFISTSRMVMPSFWIAGGVKSVYKDENDIPYFAAMDSKFVEVYDKIIA